jgi:hypothetical protein
LIVRGLVRGVNSIFPFFFDRFVSFVGEGGRNLIGLLTEIKLKLLLRSALDKLLLIGPLLNYFRKKPLILLGGDIPRLPPYKMAKSPATPFSLKPLVKL